MISSIERIRTKHSLIPRPMRLHNQTGGMVAVEVFVVDGIQAINRLLPCARPRLRKPVKQSATLHIQTG